MDINTSLFYEQYREQFYPRLKQSQVDGYNQIISSLETYVDYEVKPPAPYAHLDVLQAHSAYILATVYHETGERIEPVREGFKDTDAEAIAHVAWMHRKGFISRDYGKIDPETGFSYFGRGYVQLTHRDNYLKAGEMLGLGDLFVWNPDLVMIPENAADILVWGMLKGIFTGVQLFQYINSTGKDYYRARKIINGLDRANIIKGYAEKFEKCITLQ